MTARGRRLAGSIVIPAHDEAEVIQRCLDHLLKDLADDVQVVVSCNGCQDDTADIARRYSPRVRVLESPTASKVAAIRGAEAVATALPRLHLDADVVLPGSSAMAVLDRLAGGEALAARPVARHDTAGSSPAVRRYYRARSRLPVVATALWGAGVYGLAATGRERFGQFPDVVADDLFVDGLFDRSEVVVVDCEPATVTAPASTRELVTVLRRVYRGNAQQRSAPARRSTSETTRQLAASIRSGPHAAGDALTYAALVVAARLVQRLRPAPAWERDDSSRRSRIPARALSGEGLR